MKKIANLCKKYCCVFLTLLAPLAWAGLGPNNPAGGVGLAWDKSTDPTVNAYAVYMGSATRNYTNVINLPLTSSNTVETPLVRGVTYYFAATCIATNGLESDFSAEVTFTVPNKPNPPVLRLSMLGNGQVQLAITSEPYNTCVVQASEDLRTWTTIGQVTPGSSGVSSFVDITAPFYYRRFYRTLC